MTINSRVVILVLTVTLIFQQACVENISVEVDEGISKVVVDGYIDTRPGPYFIRLSSTGDLDGVTNSRIGEGAVVGVFDEEDNLFLFQEVESGLYSSEGSGLIGEIGKSYRLSFTLTNNESFFSSWQTIPEPVTVDRLSTEYDEETIQIDEFNSENLRFHNVLLTLTNNQNNQFFKVENSGFDSLYIEFPTFFFNDPCPQKQLSCWRFTNFGVRPLIGSNQFISGNNFRFDAQRVPLNGPGDFAGEIEVFSMQPNAYSYWTKINEQLEKEGSMFDSPIAPIDGNIHSNSGESEALGFFNAYSTTEISYCIERSNLSVPFFPAIGCICENEYPNAVASLPVDLQFCRFE